MGQFTCPDCSEVVSDAPWSKVGPVCADCAAKRRVEAERKKALEAKK